MKSYFQTFRLFCSSLRFIQFRACCCGSIHIGNLLALVVKIPFWIDNSSGGRPSDVHLLEKESHPNLIAIRLLQNYTVYIKKNLFLKHLKFSHPIFEKLIFQIKLQNFIKLFISYKHYNFHSFSVKTSTHTCWLPLHWSVVPPAWMVHSVGPPFYVSLPPSPCTPYHYGIPS